MVGSGKIITVFIAFSFACHEETSERTRATMATTFPHRTLDRLSVSLMTIVNPSLIKNPRPAGIIACRLTFKLTSRKQAKRLARINPRSRGRNRSVTSIGNKVRPGGFGAKSRSSWMRRYGEEI